MTKVAFVGLGVMGYPMAGHLKNGGHDVTVYNRTAATAEKWVAEYGGASAPSPREAVAGAEIAFTMVGNDDDVRAVERMGQTVHREAEVRRLLEEQMRVDFNELNVARDQLPALEGRVMATDNTLSGYREQFDLGLRSLLDVLDVQNELLTASNALVDGEFRYRGAHYQILSTAGMAISCGSSISCAAVAPRSLESEKTRPTRSRSFSLRWTSSRMAWAPRSCPTTPPSSSRKEVNRSRARFRDSARLTAALTCTTSKGFWM
ncbi:MAG: NAD(P)-binding domain-containing protein [Proteobacteria bacterium]|nr:NAD(P)-binding domain-containing protein [Pseudomonadota bacterium]